MASTESMIAGMLAGGKSTYPVFSAGCPRPVIDPNNPPSCQIAKCPGNKGATIYPLGCKVRRVIDANMVKSKTNRAGQSTVKVRFSNHANELSLPAEIGPMGYPRQSYKFDMIVDSGAVVTSMSVERAAGKALQAALHANGYQYKKDSMRDAAGVISPTKTFMDVPFTLIATDTKSGAVVRETITVDELQLMPTGDYHLLGYEDMRKFKRIKFVNQAKD